MPLLRNRDSGISETEMCKENQAVNLGVDHLIFDGEVVQIPSKISSICFWLEKNILQNSYEGKKYRAALTSA